MKTFVIVIVVGALTYFGLNWFLQRRAGAQVIGGQRPLQIVPPPASYPDAIPTGAATGSGEPIYVHPDVPGSGVAGTEVTYKGIDEIFTSIFRR